MDRKEDEVSTRNYAIPRLTNYWHTGDNVKFDGLKGWIKGFTTDTPELAVISLDFGFWGEYLDQNQKKHKVYISYLIVHVENLESM